MGRVDPVAKAAEMDYTVPTPAEVRRVLGQIASELDAIADRQKSLWRARRTAYMAGRDLDPPLTQVDLAAAARVSQVQVARALAARPD